MSDFKGRLLSSIKRKAVNDFKVYGFDVETHQIREDYTYKNGHKIKSYRQEFLMGSVVGYKLRRIFWDKDEMIDFMLNINIKRRNKCYFFATNLEFDFNILFGDRLNDFSLIYRNKLLGVKYKRHDNKNILFTDTMNYLQVGLDKLADVVKEEKLGYPSTFTKDSDGHMYVRKPKDKIERLQLELYNLNDSLVTYKFAELFKNFCTEHNISLKFTIASTGLDFIRRNYFPETLIRETDNILKKHFGDPDDDNKKPNGTPFKGGMTVIYKRGTIPGKAYYYDYRNSYGACMSEGVDGTGEYPNPNSSKFIKHMTTDHIDTYDGITLAKVKIPYMYNPLLGHKDTDGKLIFPYGTFKGWHTNLELREVMKYGGEVEPIEGIIYQDSFKPFREAMKVLTRLRNKYKIENNPFQACVKTLINGGLFGKWGTNYLKMQEIISEDRFTFQDDGRIILDGEIVDDINFNEMSGINTGIITRNYKGKPQRYSFPILSSTTTALGRRRLWRDCRYCPKELIYNDTDSAIVTRPIMQESPELGGWELENTILSGIMIKPKLYTLETLKQSIYKSKGARIDDGKTFYNMLSNSKIPISRFSKMIESARIGIKSGSVLFSEKNINFEDTKRKWSTKFKYEEWEDSEPLFLIDGQTKKQRNKDYIKAQEYHQKIQDKRQETFFKSDLWDSSAVGSDLTDKEAFDIETGS